MKRLALIIALCLPAVAAGGTFELADPANQIIDEYEAEVSEEALSPGAPPDSYDEWLDGGIENTACADYVEYRAEGSKRYRASVNWLVGFINGAVYQRDLPGLDTDDDRDAMARWIEVYCLDFPLDSLGGAAMTYVEDSVEQE